MFILGYVFIPRIFPLKVKEVKQSEPTISQSVCDEVLKQAELAPVKLYKGKPAKVDFSTNPDAKMFYTAITENAGGEPNFAGHFYFVGWGCGTDCAGFAIIDSITGKINKYVPFDEEGNSYSHSVDSRLLVLNPRSGFDNFKGKTISEIYDEDSFLAGHIRKYYELVEDSDGEVWLHKLCTESILDGVYALPGKYIGLPITYEAKIKSWSTSGDIRFYWYDVKTNKIINPEDQFSWFFAIPSLVSNDEKTTDNWVKFIEENKNAVFKITGTRLNDDCGYYDPDHCIENIDIKKIKVVGTNKLMEF